MGKDKWDKVIEYLTHSNRDPQKVLNLLKGNDQGKESNYDVNRASYSLNVIGTITQRSLDPENKGKTLTHIIRQWVKSKDFIQFYNLMRSEEKITWEKNKIEEYVKQLKDLWYSKAQSKNKAYFKKTDGYVILGMGFKKTTGKDILERKTDKIKPKAKIIEKLFDKIKSNNRRSRTTVS